MQLPPMSHSARRFVLFGCYVAAALRRRGLTDLADQVDRSTQEVKHAARTLEDLEEELMRRRAARFATDLDVDDTAQATRFTLASRGRTATQEPPYTKVFHSGIDYYIAARLEDQTARYEELIKLLTSNLAADDPIVVEQVPALTRLLSDWQAAHSAVTSGEADETQASLRVDDAKTALRATGESVYGELTRQLGRKKADSFFP